MMYATVAASQEQCLPQSQRASAWLIQNFENDPTWILQYTKNNGDKIDNAIANLIATNPTLLPLVRTLVLRSTASERAAIAAGLGHAMEQCVAKQPESARAIFDFIRRVGDPNVRSGFASIDQKPADLAPGQQTSIAKHRGHSVLTDNYGTKLDDPFAAVPLAQ